MKDEIPTSSEKKPTDDTTEEPPNDLITESEVSRRLS